MLARVIVGCLLQALFSPPFKPSGFREHLTLVEKRILLSCQDRLENKCILKRLVLMIWCFRIARFEPLSLPSHPHGERNRRSLEHYLKRREDILKTPKAKLPQENQAETPCIAKRNTQYIEICSIPPKVTQFISNLLECRGRIKNLGEIKGGETTHE
jgi:hypothetical protein